MIRSKTRWIPVEADPQEIQRLAEGLSVHPTIARLLIRRGQTDIETAQKFLRPSMDYLHDPYQLDGMKEAVERIRFALTQQEKILIYGDYDADGVSSTSLLLNVFRTLTQQVDYYIPNRFREGYGLNQEALKEAKERGYDLVVTVDTGISATKEAAFAREIGLDLIITDHHEPPPELPEAVAVINPKKPNCTYPFKSLAGVGVAFKLATALLDRIPTEWMDLVAIGTIADLVPLVDENRVLATYGLERLNERTNKGLSALMDVAGVDKQATAGHVGFFLGPRINASGRLDSAGQAVELLTTDDLSEAQDLAEKLQEMNQERQQIVEEITEQAIAMVEQDLDRYQHVIVVARPGWNVGVIGIVASRLVEKYYRPVIVLGCDEETGIAKGSARSIAGFDLYESLTACKEYLPQFGGHYMAAGMSLKIADIPAFHVKLSGVAQETLQVEDYIPLTHIDDELTIDQVELSMLEQLALLEPYGMGNATPSFLLKDSSIAKIQTIGADKNHLKLTLQMDRIFMDALAFRKAELAEELVPTSKIHVVGELQINEWNGRRTPQLICKDLAVHERQIFDWRSNHKGEHLNKLRDKPVLLIGHQFSAGDNAYSFLSWEDCARGAEESLAQYTQIAWIDPPPSMEIWRNHLNQIQHIERVYFIFGDRDFDQNLLAVPSREQFKQLYNLLYGKKPFSLLKSYPSLTKRTGLSKRTLSFMIQVFEELQFLQNNSGVIQIVESPSKRPLTDSLTYRQQLEKEEVLQTLVYSSYKEICQMFSGL
ncbi:single-stranded-DNA-specific exonuclease [Croceifilum oryzae]|uniref:Single-stranded-DNA-specific exonuclease RecJ n=1 Tax=Croceifilum oryzae TaxID=1553429 RepID=A0AAJ1WTZ7_9BACL|nr:single-stranded-DNA-specific exonuclease RecJ [Croceifilum oryzae]MDQ0417506.1 single-stranded-DNA-specific exonuclease [Croceifilum oryzae]